MNGNEIKQFLNERNHACPIADYFVSRHTLLIVYLFSCQRNVTVSDQAITSDTFAIVARAYRIVVRGLSFVRVILVFSREESEKRKKGKREAEQKEKRGRQIIEKGGNIR